MENLFELILKEEKIKINKKINSLVLNYDNYIYNEYIKAIITEISTRKNVFLIEKKAKIDEFAQVLEKFGDSFYKKFIEKEKNIIKGLNENLRFNPEDKDVFNYRNRKFQEINNKQKTINNFKKINSLIILEYKNYKI